MRNLEEIRIKKLALKRKIDGKEKEIIECGERLLEPITNLKKENSSIKNRFSFGMNAFQWFMTGRQIWRFFGVFKQSRKRKSTKKRKRSKRLSGFSTVLNIVSKFAR